MKNQFLWIIFLFVSSFFSASVFCDDRICNQWKAPTILENLPTTLLKEVSGMAMSHDENWRYFINDSGSFPELIVENVKLKNFKMLTIPANIFIDTEDLSLGKCPESLFKNSQDCLFIADVGDNKESRKNISLFILEEKVIQKDFLEGKSYYESEVPKVIFNYPDRAHNAESFFIDPNSGERGMILTKTTSGLAQIFSFNLEKWEKTQTISLEELASLPVADKLANIKIKKASRSITSMDVSPQGDKILFLSYGTAFELPIDVTNAFSWQAQDWRAWFDKEQVHPIGIKNLEQQESIAYFPNGKDFLYTTESKKQIPLYKMTCAN